MVFVMSFDILNIELLFFSRTKMNLSGSSVFCIEY